MTMNADLTGHLLVTALQATVPLRIHEMEWMNDMTAQARTDFVQGFAPALADAIASRADVMLYSGKTRTERRDCAATFNSLARAIAALSYSPGGVTVFGITWCAVHAPYGTTARGGLCPQCESDAIDRAATREAAA